RLLPERVPDLYAPRSRRRLATRAAGPDAGGDGGSAGAGRRGVPHAHRPVPGLPRVRAGVSVRRAVRVPARACAVGDRAVCGRVAVDSDADRGIHGATPSAGDAGLAAAAWERTRAPARAV